MRVMGRWKLAVCLAVCFGSLLEFLSCHPSAIQSGGPSPGTCGVMDTTGAPGSAADNSLPT